MSLNPLIDGIIARLGERAEAAPFLRPLQSIRDLAPETYLADLPDPLPVQVHWPAAIAGDPLGPIVDALVVELRRRGCGWWQNPNYRVHPPSATFLDNYGYLECVGPDAAYRSADLRLGFLLLGPRTHYPRHHHPAEEIYLPLGPGRWFKDGADWREKTSGDVIHHPPECGHATESGDAPLAAIYLWRGAIAKAAEIG